MKTADQLRKIKNDYEKTLAGEKARIVSIFEDYNPIWDKEDEKILSLLSIHYYDMEKYFNEHGYSIEPVIGYNGEDIDTILAENEYITVSVTW